MKHHVPRRSGVGWLAAAAGVLLCLPPQSVWAYTPDDPVVKGMVDRGVAYLESASDEELRSGESADVGGPIIAAYAHHKARQDPDVPLVQRGIKSALELAEQARRGDPGSAKINYELAVAILLLIDVNPHQYHEPIETLRDALLYKQRAGGEFTYKGYETGDTSQSQYAALALWSLDRADFDVNPERVDALGRWFLRVQDISGAWPYQAEDPGGGGLIKQSPYLMSHSTTLAGTSSLLIVGDFFRLWGRTTTKEDRPAGLPPALIEVASVAQAQRKRQATQIRTADIQAAISRARNYFRAVPYQRKQGSWHYYQLYTTERFESFAEIAAGRQEKSPAWYNEVVDELLKHQADDGSWGGPTDRMHTGGPTSTAFAILFLIRSTKKAIGTLSEGTLAGGYELPKDTTQIRVVGTQIKGAPVANAVTDLLDLLEQDGADELDGRSIPDDLKLAADPEQRRRQVDRLERLVRGSQSWQARRVAARLLGQSDELRVVPSLIFALGDPDSQVKRFARDGLRMISRRFDGFGMPDRPTDQQVLAAQTQWRQWYQSLDPGYVFLDQDL